MWQLFIAFSQGGFKSDKIRRNQKKISHYISDALFEGIIEKKLESVHSPQQAASVFTRAAQEKGMHLT